MVVGQREAGCASFAFGFAAQAGGAGVFAFGISVGGVFDMGRGGGDVAAVFLFEHGDDGGVGGAVLVEIGAGLFAVGLCVGGVDGDKRGADGGNVVSGVAAPGLDVEEVPAQVLQFGGDDGVQDFPRLCAVQIQRFEGGRRADAGHLVVVKGAAFLAFDDAAHLVERSDAGVFGVGGQGEGGEEEGEDRAGHGGFPVGERAGGWVKRILGFFAGRISAARSRAFRRPVRRVR